MRDLRRYWPDFLTDHLGLCDRLIAAYDAPRRTYHDTRHLIEVFERIDVLLECGPRQAVNRDVVLLAAWYHDAVYEAGGQDEELSARLAERELAAAAVPPRLAEEVARLVRLTATHRPAADDTGGMVLCDADLGVLAEDPARYEEYARGVREEYAAVPDPEFRVGRASVLTDLLSQPTLFGTEFGRQRWEERARRNIERELSGLESQTEQR
ncbi:MAG: hypothetical protein M3393_01055 [Actinomycetota bacterium]|nr:hypothetical protein [Actinomycetota bacterium]